MKNNVVVSNDVQGYRVRCPDCGLELMIQAPIEVTAFVKTCNAWAKPHDKCARRAKESR